MSHLPERLDVIRLGAELDRFVRDTRAIATIEEQAVLQHGRLLLTRLAALPAGEPLSSDATAEPQAGTVGWQAVRLRYDSGEQEITCWRERDGQALLHGRWDGGTLELVHVQVGERCWAAHHTARSESRFSTDPSRNEAMAERRLSGLERRMREERERWDEATAVHRWRCERCLWENEADDVTCSICGAPATGSPVGGHDEAHDAVWVGQSEKSAGDDTGGAPRHTIELPEGLDDTFGELFDIAKETLHRREAGRSPEQLGSGASGFDVILQAFDEAKKISVVRAVRDARDSMGDAASGLADAKHAVEHLPAVICHGISAAGAEEIRELLERAGATVEVRRSEG